MRIDWRLSGDYAEIGGAERMREALEEALAALPREHLRQMEALIVRDEDPKGKSLGIWRQDQTGCAIELYVGPHVRPLLLWPAPVRDFALRLSLAYTLFHEVGHHVTRFLNKRAAPPRKAPVVNEKIERWADEYAEKRMARLCARWLCPGGLADSPKSQNALGAALQALRLDQLIRVPTAEGTTAAGPSS